MKGGQNQRNRRGRLVGRADQLEKSRRSSKVVTTATRSCRSERQTPPIAPLLRRPLTPHRIAPSPRHLPTRGLLVGHTGLNVARYHSTFAFGLLVPLAAGATFFGWRAVAAVALVLVGTLVGTLVWRRVGTRGHALRPAQLLRLGLLLALMLPAELAANPTARPPAAEWAILPAAGLLLVVVCWLAGPGGGGRVHPVLTVYLLLAVLYPAALATHTVLQRTRLVAGDVTRADRPTAPGRAAPDAWRWRPLAPPPADAVAVPPAADALLAFTRGRSPAGVTPSGIGSVDDLLRDRLPPLEDVALGAVPGPVGTTSAVAVIIGGLFLLYRGLIDFRVPLLVIAFAWVTLLVSPIPLPTTAGGHRWQWLAAASPDVGWATGSTFVNYEVLASPLLFTAFFLAGSPSVRPLGRPARSAYAAAVGVAAAVLQLYVSVALGSYLAVLLAGLFASDVDRRIGTRPLV